MQVEFVSGPVLPTTSPIAHVVDQEALPAGLEPVIVEGARASRFAGKTGQLHEAFVPRDGAVVRVALAGAGEPGGKDRSAALERAGAAITAKYLASGESAVTIDFSGTKLSAADVCAVLLGALIISRVDYVTFAQTRANYMKNFDLMTNFNPFETIRLYINAIKYDYIGMEIPLSNLVGNAMLFMPMAVFLPCLFRPMRKLWVFALTMLLTLVAVEALQLLLACGSCDVDDALLNLSGTLIVFGILKIPFLQRLLQKLYLLPEDIPTQEPAAESPAPPTATA